MDAAAWTPNSQSQRRKRPAKPASDSGSKGDTGKRVLMACLCCRRRKIRVVDMVGCLAMCG
ncbi:RHTO0S01e14268g2_1 [Rhodotorula toruloides]|uniref:RHTO0S01e14268g2_1 n=1 Tax=Rhodotorula toruloides TaxID=5286 RepID=A0A061AMZ2_RHOTO|nr:RHTO0S01e14268g2_1 [Rhodotorula toruloides]